ncbi:MAG: hypothetical protein DMF90_04895 [Acidobacteria bacterium]|nr:MAG: hypothetical protein DMF90_04895 [Acidobacteriota bacterium]
MSWQGPAAGSAACPRCAETLHRRFARAAVCTARGSGVLLVDTSAWIEVFRRPARITLAVDRIVTCLSVVQEVLQGFDDERAFEIARTAMYALPCVETPLTDTVVDNAVDIYRRARRAGVTVRSSVDCLVAACALRNHLTIVHRDRDYANIAKVVALEQTDISPLLKRVRGAARGT